MQRCGDKVRENNVETLRNVGDKVINGHTPKFVHSILVPTDAWEKQTVCPTTGERD